MSSSVPSVKNLSQILDSLDVPPDAPNRDEGKCRWLPQHHSLTSGQIPHGPKSFPTLGFRKFSSPKPSCPRQFKRILISLAVHIQPKNCT